LISNKENEVNLQDNISKRIAYYLCFMNLTANAYDLSLAVNA
jgi:hypothetical protein